MKAGKETEMYNQGYMDGYNDGENAHIDPDYWTRLEHQYAGMAMQGLLNNNLLSSVLFKTGTTHVDYINEVVTVAEEYAHALVEKLKEMEERK